jgi:methylenetetrahydrofolate dehydrogenase (NADP+)/methenyltetrahydrofolate cyclohydrolase
MLCTPPDDLVRGNVLDGRKMSQWLRSLLVPRVEALAARGVVPTLAVVRVGEDAASEVYVNSKVRGCEALGIRSRHVHVPANVGEHNLVQLVRELNEDDEVDGLLVQLPLPEGVDKDRVIDAVDPRKDVDGFHPLNLGLLMSRRALLEPCTPSGVMQVIRHLGIQTRGRRAVVVGRSVIVGRPMSQMLLRAHATVTTVHRHSGEVHTDELERRVREADIVVVAAGVPGLVKGDWIRPGAAVFDVGMNRLADGRLVGDVEFEVAKERAGLITSVPGGVGLLTVTMLLWNTVTAAENRRAANPTLRGLRVRVG